MQTIQPLPFAALVSHLVQKHKNNCSRCSQMLGRGRRRSGGYANWLTCQWHVNGSSEPLAKNSPTDDNADGCISGNYYGYERGGTLGAGAAFTSLWGVADPMAVHAEIKVVEADGYYIMGDGPEENQAVAKERARADAKRAASEQAGIYVESIYEVKMSEYNIRYDSKELIHHADIS